MINAFKSLFTFSLPKLNPPEDPQLDSKLQKIAQQILKSQNPFLLWHQLSLEQSLSEIYKSSATSRNLIIQFFTLLLTNCFEELLVCKLVCSSLVLLILTSESTQLNSTQEQFHAQHHQDLSAYKISLMKAYLATINKQTVKYMIFDDHLPVLEACIQKYTSKEQYGLVQHTSLGNSILNTFKKSNEIELLWECLKITATQTLLTHCFDKLTLDLQKNNPLFEDVILFLVDLIKTIKNEKHKQFILNIIKNDINFISSKKYTLNVIIKLFPLVKQCHYERQFIEKSVNIDQILNQFGIWIKMEQYDQINSAIVFIYQISHSKYSLNITDKKKQQKIQYQQNQILELIQIQPNLFKQKLIKICQMLLEFILDKLEYFHQLKICPQLIKYILLSLSILTKQQSYLCQSYLKKIILKIFAKYLQFQQEIILNQGYQDSIINWYQNDSPKLIDNMFIVSQEQSLSDQIKKIWLTLQYLRNFRFIIIPETHLNINQISIQNIYPSPSPGRNYAPGQLICDKIQIVDICWLKNTNIPLQSYIIKDQDCLIISMKNQESYHILINIRHKNIQNININGKILYLSLLGGNQLKMDFNTIQQSQSIKKYILTSQQKSKHKQIKLIIEWLQKFKKDTIQIINQL